MKFAYIYIYFGGARGVLLIVVGNGHGDTSSNPGRDWLHFAMKRERKKEVSSCGVMTYVLN